MSGTPAPRRFAVIGSPIAHSLSPVLHRTAYEQLGITDATYDRFEVRAGELEEFLRSDRGRKLDGLSVTMPGKPEAFAVADARDEASQRLGVANTLIRRPGGTLRAENHDVHGIAQSLRERLPGQPATGGVLGSGATAASAVLALTGLGVGEIALSARSEDKLLPLEALAAEGGASVRRVPWSSSQDVLAADAVVSALAADGARAVGAAWSQVESLPVPAVFLDAIYDPWPAPLAAVVQSRDGVVVDGLTMLAHQADQQLRSMLGVDRAPVEPMLRAARAVLAGKG